VARLDQLDAIVLGISVDSHWANTAFAKQLGLSFPLLSDWDREASKAYGVLLSPSGYSHRALFVVDKLGRLVQETILEDIAEIPDLEKAIDALKALD
jgi:peroxiredoxin